MPTRSNEEWLAALRTTGAERDAALAELWEYLRRAAFFYLQRHRDELRELAPEELDALAEDAAQEAALGVLAKLDTFRGTARFLTWAAKFSVGCALVALRKRQWRDVSLDRLPDGWEEPAPFAVSLDGWAHPELASQRLEAWRVVRDAVRKDLTERQRFVLNALLIHGVSAEVVAQHLGLTAGAIYKLTHDARRKLKNAVERRGLSREEILSAFANPA